MPYERESFDDITIGHLKLLLSIAALGSFTLAGNAVGLSPAAVSKAVKRSEDRLGVSLFVRSTRQLRLTDAGERYLVQCRSAVSLFEEAERQAGAEQAKPSGELRLSLPTLFARWRLAPKLPLFFRRYPAISLSLHVSDHSVDLTGERFDLAIRGHELADSGMIARKLEDAELVIVASPEYLSRAPALNTPDDLQAHQCIQFRLPGSGRISGWSIRGGGIIRELQTTGHLVCEEDYLSGLALARAGAGLYQMYRFAVAEDLASGRLVELLPAYGGATRPFYIIYPDSAAQPAKLRAMIDFLASEVAGRSVSG
jgi:DNA-binding transcriptional LysR family regulator